MKYNAAIIGIGRIGYLLQKDKKREQPASHSIALKNNKSINLSSVCDIDKKKIDLWKKDYPRVKTYKDYLELMKKERPDIVVIAVDELSHLDVTINVIEYNPKLIIFGLMKFNIRAE